MIPTTLVNTGATSAAAPAPPSGRIWPILVMALIGMNMLIVGVTVYLATSDKSAAIEPNYYAKALKYEDTMRQRQQSDALGWTATPALTWPSAEGAAHLVLTLAGRDGLPLTDAQVQVVVFAHARSGARQTLTLNPESTTPGTYASPMPIDRAGLWHVEVTARRASDVFVCERDVLVAPPPSSSGQ